MNSRTTFSFLLIFVLLSITNQNEVTKALSLLKKCSKAYASVSNFSFEVDYAIYADKVSAGTLLETGTGKFIRSGTNIYQEEIDVIKVLNDKYLISIFNSSQVISITRRTENSTVSPFEFDMDSLATLVEKSSRTGERSYKIDFKASNFSAIEFKCNEQNYIEYYRMFYRYPQFYKEKLINIVAEMKYFNMQTKTKPNETLFKTETYLTGSKYTFTPRGKYKNYRVLNNMY